MKDPLARAEPPPVGPPPDVDALFAAHAEALCRTIHSLTGRREVAQDVVQDVFAWVYARRDTLVDGPGMRSFLFRVAINRMRHDIRSTGRYRAMLDRFELEPRSVLAMPEDEVRRRQHAARIEECVLEIPLVYREAFVLFELEGHSGQEIAEALEIDVKTVWTRLHKARLAFRGAWTARRYHE